MIPITYIHGNATLPKVSGNKIIAHICNDIGRWGSGFVLSISKRWSKPEQEYRNWHRNQKDSFLLGQIQIVKVDKELWVANMIGQHKVQPYEKIPIRYEAVDECLEKLANSAIELKASVHMPRIGCGLAGGNWESIEPLIQKNLCQKNVHVFVYDFNKGETI